MRAQLKKQIQQAKGEIPADLVLKNCSVIDVLTKEIRTADIAICGDTIAGVGDYSGVQELDVKGSYVAPGFIEGHIHIESSMLCPSQFAETVVKHGTTTVVCDPHEIANVAGTGGIDYFIQDSADAPISIYCMAPSCVPATHLENAGATIGEEAVEQLLERPEVVGLAEMMNFPGVLMQDGGVLSKLNVSLKKEVPIDGHAPGLSGKELQAYVGAGIRSDHECITAEEATEKVRSGMYVFMREGSTAKNLHDLLPAVTEANASRFLLVTDDCHPEELLQQGHLDRILRKAIHLGLNPITAIQMVTINASTYFGFDNLGVIAPGFIADLVVFDDLKTIQVEHVVTKGKVYTPKDITAPAQNALVHKRFSPVFDSVHIKHDTLSFAMKANAQNAWCITLNQDSLITDMKTVSVKIKNGMAVADTERDILKVAVVERHRNTGNIGQGFVQGIGIKAGALASTVGHDSHNILVVGADDDDMCIAVETIAKQKGGLAVVHNGKVIASLTLNVAGLMSELGVEEVAAQFNSVLVGAKKLGSTLDDPFMVMSFLALPVIPHLKITDMGLVNVDSFCHIPLWQE